MLRLTMFDHNGSALLKAVETIKSHLVKGFQFTLLGVSLVRGLMVIHLECHPIKGFTNAY